MRKNPLQGVIIAHFLMPAYKRYNQWRGAEDDNRQWLK